MPGNRKKGSMSLIHLVQYVHTRQQLLNFQKPSVEKWRLLNRLLLFLGAMQLTAERTYKSKQQTSNVHKMFNNVAKNQTLPYRHLHRPCLPNSRVACFSLVILIQKQIKHFSQTNKPTLDNDQSFYITHSKTSA